MSNALVALLFGAGVAGWAYSQAMRRIGGANMTAVIVVTAMAGIIAFFFLYTLLAWVLNI